MVRQTHDPSCAEPEIEQVVLIQAVKFGLVLAAVFLLFNCFLMGTLIMGLGMALAGGIGCAIMRFPAIRDTFKKLEENPPVFPGETIHMEGYVTHHRSFEGACPGYLCLTDRMLHFRSYPFDGKLDAHIPLCEIDRIETYNHLCCWPSGIRLVMRSGKRVKFTVRSWREGWQEEMFRAWRRSVHRRDSQRQPGRYQPESLPPLLTGDSQPVLPDLWTGVPANSAATAAEAEPLPVVELPGEECATGKTDQAEDRGSA